MKQPKVSIQDGRVCVENFDFKGDYVELRGDDVYVNSQPLPEFLKSQGYDIPAGDNDFMIKDCAFGYTEIHAGANAAFQDNNFGKVTVHGDVSLAPVQTNYGPALVPLHGTEARVLGKPSVLGGEFSSATDLTRLRRLFRETREFFGKKPNGDDNFPDHRL